MLTSRVIVLCRSVKRDEGCSSEHRGAVAQQPALTLFAAAIFLFAAAGALAQRVVFFDDFAGPRLSEMWQASLPDAFQPSGSIVERYVGAPRYAFASFDGNSVLRMGKTLRPRERCGWSSTGTFTGQDFRYEVRFNTLDQRRSVSIDGFIEIWILDASNSNHCDIISLFGGNYSSSREFFAGSSIDNVYTNFPFSYQNNTYYRLVLESGPGHNVRAAVLSDDGAELIGYSFDHSAAVFCAGFRIGLSQAMGLPTGPSPVDVAVDFVRVSTGGPGRNRRQGPLISPKAAR